MLSCGQVFLILKLNLICFLEAAGYFGKISGSSVYCEKD